MNAEFEPSNRLKPSNGRPRRVEDDEYIAVAAWAAKQGEQMPPSLSGRAAKSELLTARNGFRRLSNMAGAEAKKLIEKPGDQSDALDDMMKTLDVLARLVAETQKTLDHQELAASMDTESPGTWRGASGQTLRALSKNDQLTREGIDIPLDFGFGQFVAAMVNGTQNPAVRNALSEGTDSAGGYTTPTQLTKQLIDAMRAKAVTIQAGAMTLPLDAKTTTIARVVSDPGCWMALGERTRRRVAADLRSRALAAEEPRSSGQGQPRAGSGFSEPGTGAAAGFCRVFGG